MVYVEPVNVGWQPLLASFLQFHVPKKVSVAGKAHIEQLFRALVPACLLFVRKFCTEPVPTSDLSLVAAFLRLFESLLDEFRVAPDSPSSSSGGETKRGSARGAKGGGKKAASSRAEEAMAAAAAEMGRPVVVSDLNVSNETKFLECAFAFGLVWSVGASIDGQGRVAFDQFLRTLMDGKLPTDKWDLGARYAPEGPPPKMGCAMPQQGMVYDYLFDKQVWVFGALPSHHAAMYLLCLGGWGCSALV
jgi:dynein heavy chain